MINQKATLIFQKQLYDYYREHGRHDLPWRQPEADGSFDAYKIMVSEVMLQQTQVFRVIPKFTDFIRLFPTIDSLAKAELGAVLRTWSGLGYNRRAKFLHQAARQIRQDYMGNVPQDPEELVRLPGIGPNTAAAIVVYSFNQPMIFIETNIRTVFIHHFFPGRTAVTDKAILEIVQTTLDHDNPRTWYWSLMDYGTYLKQTVGNLNKASKSYAKQSTFHGSRRQIRGRIIRVLGERTQSQTALAKLIDDDRFPDILQELLSEGLVHKERTRFSL